MMSHTTLQIRTTDDCPASCGTCETVEETHEMSASEFVTNLDYFLERHTLQDFDEVSDRGEQAGFTPAQRGGFGKAPSKIADFVLSGALTVARDDFRELLIEIKKRSFRKVTVISDGMHWTDGRIDACRGIVDRIVVDLSPASSEDWQSESGESARKRAALRSIAAAGIAVQTSTQLRPPVIEVLESLVDTLLEQKVVSPTFAFPFATPGLGAQPAWKEIEPAVTHALRRLEARDPKLKNIPRCVLGPLAQFTHKTNSRLYVKHDRQLDNHAVIPPFVGTSYEGCDGCAEREQCDGYWIAHVQAGRIGQPRPV